MILAITSLYNKTRNCCKLHAATSLRFVEVILFSLAILFLFNPATSNAATYTEFITGQLNDVLCIPTPKYESVGQFIEVNASVNIQNNLWVNTNLGIKENQDLIIQVRGEVTTCNDAMNIEVGRPGYTGVMPPTLAQSSMYLSPLMAAKTGDYLLFTIQDPVFIPNSSRLSNNFFSLFISPGLWGIPPATALLDLPPCNDGNSNYTNFTCASTKGLGLGVYVDPSLTPGTPAPTLSALNNNAIPFDKPNNFYLSGSYIIDGVKYNTIGVPVPQDGNIGIQIMNTGMNQYVYGGYNIEVIKAGCPVIASQAPGQSPGTLQYMVTDIDPNSQPIGNSQYGYLNTHSITTQAERDGNVWIKITPGTSGTLANIGYYPNPVKDYGNYNVVVKTNSNYEGIGKFASILYSRIKKELDAIIARGFTNLTQEGSPFIMFVRGVLIFYVAVTGVLFAFGIIELTATQLVARLIKVMIVAMLFSNDSFNFFNKYLLSMLSDGIIFLFNMASIGPDAGGVFTTSNLSFAAFSMFDQTMSYMFQTNVWVKIFSLMLLPFFSGFIIFAAFLYSILLYIETVFILLVSVFIAIIFITIMVSIAPFFIVMILFERTRESFFNYIKLIFDLSLQPFLLLITLMFFNKFVISSFLKSIDFPVCWGCAFPIGFNMAAVMHFIFDFPADDLWVHILCIPFFVPYDYDPMAVHNFGFAQQLIQTLILVLNFLIWVKILDSCLDLLQRISGLLTGANQFSAHVLSRGKQSVSKATALMMAPLDKATSLGKQFKQKMDEKNKKDEKGSDEGAKHTSGSDPQGGPSSGPTGGPTGGGPSGAGGGGGMPAGG